MLSAYYTKVLSHYISNYNGKCQPRSPTLRNVSTVQQHMDSQNKHNTICPTERASEMLLFELVHSAQTETLVATRNQCKSCVTQRYQTHLAYVVLLLVNRCLCLRLLFSRISHLIVVFWLTVGFMRKSTTCSDAVAHLCAEVTFESVSTRCAQSIQSETHFWNLRFPYFSDSRDFHSCVFHPCSLVPRFPLPRFQRPQLLDP